MDNSDTSMKVGFRMRTSSRLFNRPAKGNVNILAKSSARLVAYSKYQGRWWRFEKR